jgi:hypothetical protein
MSGDEPRRAERENVALQHIESRSDPFFAGLVVLAGEFHPIPFRTRPLKPPAPMVLRVNTWESRSPPGQPRTDQNYNPALTTSRKPRAPLREAFLLGRFPVGLLSSWNGGAKIEDDPHPMARTPPDQGDRDGQQGTEKKSREEKAQSRQEQEECAAGFGVLGPGAGDGQGEPAAEQEIAPESAFAGNTQAKANLYSWREIVSVDTSWGSRRTSKKTSSPPSHAASASLRSSARANAALSS